MDTREIYVRMSEKAREIQKLNKQSFVPWDDYPREPIIIENRNVFWWGLNINRHTKGEPIYKTIWLPRQDQLQEMVYSSFSPIQRLSDMNRCACHWSSEKRTSYKSMEQLTLAYVMERKYNKTWNGEDWIEEHSNS